MTTAPTSDPTAALQSGVRLLRERRPREALAALLVALEGLPERPDVWLAAGLALLECGDPRQAEAALRRAVALAPGWADGWSELGWILSLRGVRDEPIACWRRAVALSPGHVEARARLGQALLGLGSLDEAAQHLQVALSHRPGHAGAVAAAVALLERRGHDADAWALACSLDVPDVRVAIAGASVGRRLGRAQEALARVDAALPIAARVDRCLLLHARADLLDALGRDDEAFAAWDEANRSRNLVFDADRHRLAVQRLIDRTTGRTWPAGPAGGAERAALIVGVPRSGSTVLEQALSRHPAIAAGGELEALRDVAMAVPRAGEADWVDALDRLQDEDRARLRDRYLGALNAVSTTAERVTDKMPNNLLHLGVLAQILPGARVLRCVRDPLDTAWSCFRQPLGAGLPWATSLPGIAAWIREADRLLDHWQAHLPLRFHTVRYEELVRRPEEVLRGVCAFLEVPFVPDVLSPELARRTAATASVLEVKEPLHPRSIGRGRRYERHLSPAVPTG